MEQNQRQLIDGLFAKLKQAEQLSGPRDRDAEQQIAEALARQPAAPYYMSQVILVQDHAMQAQHQRIQDLEKELTEAQARAQPPAAGGGFLSGLFGGGASQTPAPAQPAAERTPVMAPGAAYAPPPPAQGRGWSNQPAGPVAGFGGMGGGGGGGFLSSALSTAAGVAGGVMLASAVSGLFGAGEAKAAEPAAAAEPPAPEPEANPDPAMDESFLDYGDGGDFETFEDF
jgi:uncharacterized protein